MKWYVLQHFEPKAKESFGNPKKFKGCLDSEVSEVLLLSYLVSELGEPVPSLEEATRFNSSEEQQEQQHQAMRLRNQLQRQPRSKCSMQNKHLQPSCLSDLS